jgi:hypothetical protein
MNHLFFSNVGGGTFGGGAEGQSGLAQVFMIKLKGPKMPSLSIFWGYPERAAGMVYFMENPNRKWMIILGVYGIPLFQETSR